MTQYVDRDYLKIVGNVPPEVLDQFEAQYPGRIDAVIEAVCRVVDGRLAKRYATPFEHTAKKPAPEAIRMHVAALVSHQLRIMIGFDPGSQQDQLLVAAKDEAWAYIKEAADSKEGLVELPLREPLPGEKDKSGVKKGGPLSSSNASPYAWADQQRQRVRRSR
ncbi:MAG: hypothetical protein BGO98_29545 [Myxococcales bacterium 68-20]|nr:DUF1320 family protein [Myxococcales bacterium]OJY30904.1 MAG: hypothetical protein BGO98_29545 [Myxococcales bacterium 68-20]